MNDTPGTDNSGLKGSFGSKGTKVNQIPYGHPHAKEIVAEAREILLKAETGQILVEIWDQFQIPIHVIKGNGEAGFSPQNNTIYLQVAGSIKTATPEVVLGLLKALREADMELAGFKTPDPSKDITTYAAFMHARNLETITAICKFVKELTNSSYFTVLLDTLPKLGLNGVYKAYIDGATREQLYDAYADAYDNERGKWL